MPISQGLTAKQVQQRIDAGQQNEPAPALTRSIKEIFRDNLLTWFNLINVVLGALVLITGSYKNELFLGVAVVNTAIGIFQEIRSKRQIDKMSLLSEATYEIKRAGGTVELHQDAIVQDDLIMMHRGDQLPVDGLIVTTKGIEVDESQITGEATPIAKTIGDAVVSGSFLVSGQAVVQATHVGTKSFINTLSGEVQSGEGANSQLLNTINRIIKILTIVIVPLGAVLFISRLLNHSSINQAILGTTAAMIGMIPEGLVLLTSVSLAVSAMNLARHRVLVRELPAIEGLARVDILGLDKTGTITSGKLQLNKIVPLQQETLAQLKLIVGGTINAIGDDNETAQALNRVLTDPGWQPIKVVPFSSARKWSGVSVSQGNYVIGAPEFILKQVPADLAQQIENYAKDGFRVLSIAKTTELKPDDLGEVFVLGLILIEDEIRENAVDTFRYFQNQDVALKVISGDNPTTVANIASRAGIKHSDQLIDMSSLGTDIDYDQLVADYTVFGRVTPAQKKQLVLAWQRAGHAVAMTGDGVNDILALRQADCGIAMASGSEAAKSIADFVLVDSNFDAMLNVLNEGRRVVNNIERVASLFLIKTMYSVVLSLIFIFMNNGYPFQPIQLTPISVLTVGIPTFFLALEPNYQRLSGQFMKQVMTIAAPAAICVVTYILVIDLVGGVQFNLSYAETSTLSVLLTGAVCLVALLMVARPLNRLKIGLVLLMAGCFALIFIFFGKLFSLEGIFNWEMAVFYLPLLASVYPFFYLVQEVVGRRILARINWR
ncbi:cation-transporting ATPase [Secundilactobacillus pentosiphilus]|uniref:Cation-transporting ATPase n=1 Tax=Secundilactobacillus pentosiphilus TaxID=1714682 RepID=A0A1Z5IY02_9LACO|nr:cation-translocating P-type ATPase [Secundilactobacillus pentosiphilus]GAX06637.1 cation-transporting ATPase [Secundilactobacillus pentosiphilus]